MGERTLKGYTLLIQDHKKIAETFNNNFNNAVKTLNLQCNPEHLNVSDENDPIYY